MRRVIFLAIASMLATAVVPYAQQQAANPVKAAADALGATNVKSIRFTGFGATGNVGQAVTPGGEWPRVVVKGYDAQINYETNAMRVDWVRQPAAGPEQRQSALVRGTDAWDLPPVAAGPAGDRRAQLQGGGGGAVDPKRVTLPEALALAGIRPPAPPAPTPQPGQANDRMVQLYLNPIGFLKAALANNAPSKKVGDKYEVTLALNGGKNKFVGIINARNEVEKITTWVDNAVLGDMPVEVTFNNYQKIDEATWFPIRIVQTSGGQTSLDLSMSSVTINPTPVLDVAVPENVKAFQPPAAKVDVQKLADNVYYLTGGTHHSVAIEMRDHVVLVEAPQSEARSVAVIAKVKETIPNKPIKFVVNTHYHFDHSGGLRTLVAEGATVVTQQANRAYYQKAWANPRTLGPDQLSQSKKAPVFLSFLDRQVLTDGKTTVQVIRMQGNPHNDAFAMVYLPASKILIEADAFNPPAAPAAPAPGAPAAAPAPAPAAAPAAVNPNTLNLYENIQRLKLDVAQIAALHGRVATLDELKKAVTPPATAGQ